MAPINFKKNILLTGAGFTANFGGLLAREMWSKILNNKKLDEVPEIKKILMNNFDFEAVYAEVINSGSFTVDQKSLFQKVVIESYGDMDETLKNASVGRFAEYGIFWNYVTNFLGLFNGSRSEPGVHFTLNQDLLLERTQAGIPLGITAVKYREYWDSLPTGQINLSRPITLYDDVGLEEFKEKHLSSTGFPYYVKLHGSQGWLSSDGNNQMVLGTNKQEDIEKEPLLKWYFQLFEEALYRTDVKLFVAGYSFRDKHVNDRILKAVQEHGLKIYVISPEDPESLRDRLEGKHANNPSASYDRLETHKIWEAINGYFPYKLKDIFPRGDVDTHIYKDIKKILEN